MNLHYFKAQHTIGYKNIPVDGYFKYNNQKYVISVLGCYFHKCKDCGFCITDEDFHIYNKTLEILNYLRQHEYIVIEFWEHSFPIFFKK